MTAPKYDTTNNVNINETIEHWGFGYSQSVPSGAGTMHVYVSPFGDKVGVVVDSRNRPVRTIMSIGGKGHVIDGWDTYKFECHLPSYDEMAENIKKQFDGFTTSMFAFCPVEHIDEFRAAADRHGLNVITEGYDWMFLVTEK